MFVIDPQDMDQCLNVSREKHGMSNDDIEKKLQYNFACFFAASGESEGKCLRLTNWSKGI